MSNGPLPSSTTENSDKCLKCIFCPMDSGSSDIECGDATHSVFNALPFVDMKGELKAWKKGCALVDFRLIYLMDCTRRSENRFRMPSRNVVIVLFRQTQRQIINFLFSLLFRTFPLFVFFPTRKAKNSILQRPFNSNYCFALRINCRNNWAEDSTK